MIKEIYPLKSQFEMDELIEIKVLLNSEINTASTVKIIIYHQNEPINIQENPAQEVLIFSYKPKHTEDLMQGYLVEVQLLYNGEILSQAFTACDRTKNWKYAPRYGFLSDFSKQDSNDSQDVDEMNKYHLNIVQFYDWMYRHHDFFPPQSDFKDIMGKESSMEVVKQKIQYLQQYNMKPFAYGAVYGAENEYEHFNDFALYDSNKQVMKFIDCIYFMDIHKSCGWHQHIIDQYRKAIEFGFKGIHMDQYGCPKEAYAKSADGRFILRELRNDFVELIDDTKEFLGDQGVIFNAVNNWPIDTVANTNQDCVYIEVWPPNETYNDLNNLISNAKRYAPSKQVILSAYLHPFKDHEDKKECEYTALLTMATIFSSGGFHLLIGEGNGVLTEAYYPDYYQVKDDSFLLQLHSYYDFIVAYEELLYNFDLVDDTRAYTGGINNEYQFRGAEFSIVAQSNKVWTQVKHSQYHKIIHLVNFTDISNMNWNEPKPSLPRFLKNITVNAQIVEDVENIYLASPDLKHGKSQKLDFAYVNRDDSQRAVEFTIPELRIWDMIYITIK